MLWLYFVLNIICTPESESTISLIWPTCVRNNKFHILLVTDYINQKIQSTTRTNLQSIRCILEGRLHLTSSEITQISSIFSRRTIRFSTCQIFKWDLFWHNLFYQFKIIRRRRRRKKKMEKNNKTKQSLFRIRYKSINSDMYHKYVQ